MVYGKGACLGCQWYCSCYDVIFVLNRYSLKAEYVFGYILSRFVPRSLIFILPPSNRERQLPQLHEAQKIKKWEGTETGYTYRPLSKLTIGIPILAKKG